MSATNLPRKDLLKINDADRITLMNSFIALNTDPKFRYPGSRDDKPFVGGITYWFKQDEIHQATHVHRGPAFLTWHRELCNRFEKLLNKTNPDVALHYWDWNYDAKDLFTHTFMGESNGSAGHPLLKASFYNPNPVDERYRGDNVFDTEHSNPYDPPKKLERNKEPGTIYDMIERERQKFAKENPGKDPQKEIPFYTDKEIIESTTYMEMRAKLELIHNYAHSYIGGTIGDPHASFRDPFVFLLHSNVDRLFAAWQLRKGFEKRIESEDVYDDEKNSESKGSTHPYVIVGIKTLLSPWCGVGYPFELQQMPIEDLVEEPGVNDVRPWAYPDNWHRNPNLFDEKPKNSWDKSILIPRLYDKFPEGFEYNYYLASEQV